MIRQACALTVIQHEGRIRPHQEGHSPGSPFRPVQWAPEHSDVPAYHHRIPSWEGRLFLTLWGESLTTISHSAITHLLLLKNYIQFWKLNLSKILLATSTYKLNKYVCKNWDKLVDKFEAETQKLSIFCKNAYFSMSNNDIKFEKYWTFSQKLKASSVHKSIALGWIFLN